MISSSDFNRTAAKWLLTAFLAVGVFQPARSRAQDSDPIASSFYGFQDVLRKFISAENYCVDVEIQMRDKTSQSPLVMPFRAAFNATQARIDLDTGKFSNLTAEIRAANQRLKLNKMVLLTSVDKPTTQTLFPDLEAYFEAQIPGSKVNSMKNVAAVNLEKSLQGEESIDGQKCRRYKFTDLGAKEFRDGTAWFPVENEACPIKISFSTREGTILIKFSNFFEQRLENRFFEVPAGYVLQSNLQQVARFAAKKLNLEPPPAERSRSVENSVVKVFATVRYPDLYKPWSKQSPTELVGSGVVFEGNRIISNAHIAQYASRIEIQANQGGDRISAKIEAIAPGIDLVSLKLEDETFFETHPPLARAKALPEIKDAVLAYGYPKGGSGLSITKGIVSRIEFASYNFLVFGLRIQIDAAINSGNSGGPAVVGEQMIGLAYSYLSTAANIGYIIPNEEIDLFLADIADGNYDGKPAMFDPFQSLDNPALRKYLKLEKSVRGVVISKPAYKDPAYPLKEWDVITQINGSQIDNLGNVRINPALAVNFRYLVQKSAEPGKVRLKIIRHSEEMEIDLPVKSKRPTVTPDLDGTYPSYFVFGPLVFSRGSVQYVRGFMTTAADMLAISDGPLLKRFAATPSFPGEELVVISSPFLPHKLTEGYLNPAAQVVESVNGIPVRNLGHLVELLRDSKETFVVFKLSAYYTQTLVFPRAEMIAAVEGILTDNDIRSQGSPDTMAIWNSKTP